MKTSTKKAVENRLAKLVASKGISKNSLVYAWILEAIEGKGKFRPVFTQGSTWKHSSLVDKTNELSIALRQLKLDFVLTNDAPRGGKTGALITVTTKIK